MKQLIIKSALLVAALIIPGKNLAEDKRFIVGDIAYKQLSDYTCEVTSKTNSEGKYEGEITIAGEVWYNGELMTVTGIGDDAFVNCKNLTGVNTYSNSNCFVESIGTNAFSGCTSIKSIRILSPVRTIGAYAFAYCKSLTSIDIPNSAIMFIEGSTFRDCESLTSIRIPNSVRTIDLYAFSGCKSLTSVEIPNSVYYIGPSAFRDCESLASIDIPNSVRTIDQSAFSDCKSLTSIEIPSSVTTLEHNAFQNCSSLTNVKIPNSITKIKESLFDGCSSLKNVDIPTSVTWIEPSAFNGCESLTSIHIPNSVTKIGSNVVFSKGVFLKCSNLRDFVFEDGEKDLEIGLHVFDANSPVEKLYLGRNLVGGESLGDLTTLVDVTIGSLVTDVTLMPWTENKDLTSIKSLAKMPPKSNSFTEAQYANVRVSVPVGSLLLYKADEVWGNFFNLQEEETSGVWNVETSGVTEIKTENGNIVIENSKGKVCIYDMAGTLIKSADTNGGRVEFAVPQRGVYIVRTDGKTAKVAL